MPRGGAAALRAQYGALREASDGTYTDDESKRDDGGCGWACACAMVVLSLTLVAVVLLVLVEFVYEGGDLGGGGGAAVKVAVDAAKRANVSLPHLPHQLNVSSLLQQSDPNATAASSPPAVGQGPPDVVFWKLLKVPSPLMMIAVGFGWGKKHARLPSGGVQGWQACPHAQPGSPTVGRHQLNTAKAAPLLGF